MSSAVYFKFKASLKQYTIPFEGSAISVKDLRSAIRLSCGLKSTDFELQIIDKQGKDYPKEDDLIPKFSDLIVRRLPKANDGPKRKIANPEDMSRRDPYKAINALPKMNLYNININLAKANIPDDEKLDIMTKRCSEEYSEKNYLVKSKPYGVPPASYACNKCHQGGHWIHECPGLRDREGKLLDSKSVRRPTGIPQDFLLEVAPGTPGAYLTKEGKYMVPIKDAEAYAMGKKEKRPFSVEENPPYIAKDQELPPKLQCPLCSQLLESPTCTPCCSSVFCLKCISDYLYDPEVNGSRKCPTCQLVIDHHESLIENELLRQLTQCWKANMLTKEIVDSCLTSLLNASSNKKTGLNEDSSKSPPMKFTSANEDCEASISGALKTESQKIFVNNRRVLKPKTRIGSPNGNRSSSLDTNGAIGTESVKIESVHGAEKEQDVNELIYESVKEGDVDKPKTECALKTDATKGDRKLNIEIIGKRSEKDSGAKSGDRRTESRCSLPYRGGAPCDNMPHKYGGLNTQLLTHYPSSTQQMLGNTLPLNAITSLQWPIVNTIYNSIPLQTMFGAALNGVGNNWIGNGLNLPQTQPVNNVSKRILTKEEFYDRQRQLRAEKLKERTRDDSSLSGSQSPRRRRRRRRRSSGQTKYGSEHVSSRHRDKYMRQQPVDSQQDTDNRQRDLSPPDVKKEYRTNSSELKTIDPKLMNESINTFLKYLTANSDEKSDCKEEKTVKSSRRVKSEKKHSHMKIESDSVLDVVKVSRRRSTRSRSVPKISKDRLLDESRPAMSRSRKKKTHHKRRKSNDDSAGDVRKRPDDVTIVTDSAAKKSKKSKHRHPREDDDEDDNDVKTKKKHKKHKHKKQKKSKKSQKDAP